MDFLATLALVGAIFGQPQRALGGDDDQGLSYHLGVLRLGECELQEDPDGLFPSNELGFLACARGEGGGEITAVSGTPKENFWLRYGGGALGVFVGNWLSLQGRASFREVKLMQGEGQRFVDRDVDYLVLQGGNPAIDRAWVTLGREPLPFGFNLPVAGPSYQLRNDQGFWRSPRFGGTVSIDNKVNTRLDLGYGTQKPRDRATAPPVVSPDDPRDRQDLTAFSGRLTYDLSALDGSRLEVSGYGSRQGERRFGLGLMTVSRHKDVTSLEFVRRQETPAGNTEDFKQIIRFGYLGAWRNSTRWMVELDDERLQHRMGTFGAGVRKSVLIYNLDVTYFKSETGDDIRRWWITSGLEARL